MIDEITAATTFIALHLRSAVPEDTCANFRIALADRLKQRFESHWYTEIPLRGSAYRSLSLHCGRLDDVIVESAKASNVDSSLLVSALPDDFVLWIDPYCVSYRAGEHTGPVVIWQNESALASSGLLADTNAAVVDLVDRMSPPPAHGSSYNSGPHDQNPNAPIQSGPATVPPPKLPNADPKRPSSSPLSSTPIEVA